MTGVRLDHAPTQDELERLYYELSRIGATSVGARKRWRYTPEGPEQLITLASQMMRYDARLLSVLVQWLQRHYTTLNPLLLRKELQRSRWPQSLLVALEFARLGNRELEFLAFAEYVAHGFTRTDPAERFFLDTEQPGSRAAARNLGRNLAPYARWGYVGQERPIVDPVSKRTVGRYDRPTRQRILKSLAERRTSFSIADYLSAVDHGISRQQALKDLSACKEIAPSGRGRGALWQRKTGS